MNDLFASCALPRTLIAMYKAVGFTCAHRTEIPLHRYEPLLLPLKLWSLCIASALFISPLPSRLFASLLRELYIYAAIYTLSPPTLPHMHTSPRVFVHWLWGYTQRELAVGDVVLLLLPNLLEMCITFCLYVLLLLHIVACACFHI